MSLAATSVRIDLTGGETGSIGPLTAALDAGFHFRQDYIDGSSGAGKANKICAQSGTADSGSPTTIDLTACTGNAFQSSVNFSKIAAIIVKNTGATNKLLVGGAASNAFSNFVADPSDILSINPGSSRVILVENTPVTVDGTHKNLKISADTSTTTYQIIIIGVGT